MSQDNQSCDIIFNRDLKVVSACSFYWIEAFDLIGAGPLRLRQIQNLEAPLRVRVLKEFADSDRISLNEFQNKLNLQSFEVSKADIFNEFQRQIKIHFSETLNLIGSKAEELIKKYWSELPWKGGGLIAHFRYFAGFIKQELQDPIVSELVRWEWALVDVSTQEQYVEIPSDGYLSLNSSLHAVPISHGSTVLGRDKGMYCFVYAPKKGSVVQKKLDPYEAHLIDLLSGDRPCTKSQLLDMAMVFEFKPSLSTDEWQKKFESLLESDIILSDRVINNQGGICET